MTPETLRTAGTLLLFIPAVVFGGASLLWHWITRQTNYYENPLRRQLWRAGHAHAGVLLILSLLALLFVDQTPLSDQWKSVVRWTIPSAAILVPSAFFLSVVRPDVEHPNRLVNLAYLGGILASVGTVVLGIGLLSV